MLDLDQLLEERTPPKRSKQIVAKRANKIIHLAFNQDYRQVTCTNSTVANRIVFSKSDGTQELGTKSNGQCRSTDCTALAELVLNKKGEYALSVYLINTLEFLTGITLHDVISKLYDFTEGRHIDIVWKGNARPDLASVRHTLELNFSFMLHPRSNSNDTKGDMYLTGDTQYVISWAKIDLRILGWDPLVSQRDWTWQCPVSVQNDDLYTYGGNFKAVLDHIEQPLLRNAPHASFKFTYRFISNGEHGAIPLEKIPHPIHGQPRLASDPVPALAPLADPAQNQLLPNDAHEDGPHAPPARD